MLSIYSVNFFVKSHMNSIGIHAFARQLLLQIILHSDAKGDF